MAKKTLKILGFIVGSIITVSIALAIINPDFVHLSAQTNTKIGADAPPVQIPDMVKQYNQAVIDASNAIVPTVVAITVESETTVENPFGDFFRDFHPFFDFGDEGQGPGNEKRKAQGFGSGVIISSDGYIVTNNHVVENAVKDGIKVTLNDKTEHDAKLIGTDPTTDLAVIKIDAKGLTPAYLGNIDNVKIGDFVIAVGNPLGLTSTVTSGIISAIGRGPLGIKNNQYSIENYIQTDAAINPGNSGGGLFDLSGSLVGINTAIATQTGGFMGYGFAIPIDIVKRVAQDLIDNGKVNRPWLGVQISNVDEITAKSVKLPKVYGAMVQDVIKDSPAEKAGLQPGDVIINIEGHDINSTNELQTIIIKYRIGDKVKVKIWRDSKEITKELTLAPREESGEIAETKSSKESDSGNNDMKPVKLDKIGIEISPLTNSLKDKFDVKNGVLVSNVDVNSSTAKRGLTPNSIILSADQQEITSTSELKKIIDSKKPGDAVLLKVKSQNATRLVAIEIPKL
ncbi:MAG: Do family serine endopeptidase [Chloroherpetonaceae bacterium]